MDDVIYRQDAINAFQDYANYDSNRSNAEWVKRTELVISRLPSARKKGHWMHDPDESTYCSECGKYVYDDGTYHMIWHPNFCPHCGADMRGEDDE